MTQRRLVLTQDVLEDAIQRRGRPRMFRAGILRSDDREEWLVHRRRFDPASASGPRVLVAHVPRHLGAITDTLLAGSDSDLIVGFDDWGSFDVTAVHGKPGTARDDQAWRRERAGSLLLLNGLAVNLGLRLLEDFLAGRVGESTWLHLEYDANGIPSIDHFGASDVPSISCPTCQLTGLGDSGLNQFRDVVGGGG